MHRGAVGHDVQRRPHRGNHVTTLLLDADIIAFKIASVSQKTVQFDPEDEPCVHADDWEDVIPRIHMAINALKEYLRTDDVIVCLSCPTAENFRLDVLPTYKGSTTTSNTTSSTTKSS